MMRSLVALIAVLLLPTGPDLRAADIPRGDLLELHSCQLYIGGWDASESDSWHPSLGNPDSSNESGRCISY